MANHGCTNGVLDTVNYSSPLPVIGLYISAASLVCLFAMLFDIFSGLIHRKPWLPCRLLSLNSVTLTLLALAAKLPVDLTTPMPSAKDQMSKLTGTSFICVSMAFLMPSLGTNQISECFTNLAALSIFVVTVVANICIQIRTGVIVLFITEHVIVMCCMLVMIMVLWVVSLIIETKKGFAHDHNKDIIKKGEGSMLDRLKLAYLYGYNSNPQLVICKGMQDDLVSLLCIPCVVVVIEAAIRSRTLEFCRGTSDYDWSMQMIVVTQIITIVAGGLATGFRWLFMLVKTFEKLNNSNGVDDDVRDVINANPLLGLSLSDATGRVVFGLMQIVVWILTVLVIVVTQIITIVVGGLATGFRSLFMLVGTLFEKLNNSNDVDDDVRDVINANPLLGLSLSDAMGRVVFGLMQIVVWILTVLVLLLMPCLFVFICFEEMCEPCCNHNGDIDEYKHLIQEGDMKLEEWSLGKSVRDMRRWIGASKRDSLDHLSQLLLKTRRSQQLDTMELKDQLHPDQEGLQVSALSMVLLIRIAEVSIPSELSTSLAQAYSEAYEILHFINNRIHPASFKNRKISALAEAVWIGDGFSKISKKSIQGGMSQSQSNLDRALVIITELKTALPSDFVWEEVGVIIDFIQRREYSSIEALYNYIEHLVVDMLHIFLAQLPHAVFKEVTESPAEEFDERVKLALKFLCKMERFEAHIQWSFPIQCTITSLITPQVPRIVTQIEPLQDNKVDVSILVNDSQENALVTSMV